MSNTERKMAAILAMDVTSYSEKMGKDEEGTLEHLRACKEIIEGVVSENKGRIFNTAGDAFMIEFSSTISALSAAIEIQKLIKSRNNSLEETERMYFRMGVNVGDIIIEDNNLYGEGVNVAARLEGIAKPGGISISEKVYLEVRRKFNFAFEDKGLKELKNIQDPVRVFELNTGVVKKTTSNNLENNSKKKKTFYLTSLSIASLLVVATVAYFFIDTSKGSSETKQVKVSNTIVILPITNSSSDELSKNFSNGLTHDLNTSLATAAKGLNVIRLPKRPEDLSKIGDLTDSQYFIDGNLIQAGDRFRLTISLIETTKNSII
tara:strand:- start:1705 stop:2664 length:960 start_codon:yes stop_codon:yes gene_type:complete